MIYTLSEDVVDGAISAPFLKTKYLSYSDKIKDYDIIIFTSKKAIFALKNDKSWINKIIYTVGEKTKEIALKQGAKNVYSAKKSSSYDLCTEIKDKIIGKKVLYIRAKKVLFDIKEYMQDICFFDEMIVYESIFTKADFVLEKGSVVIFSSPSIIESFIRFYDIVDFKIVVIGKKTAEALRKIDKNIEYIMPKYPNLELCVQCGEKLIRKI